MKIFYNTKSNQKDEKEFISAIATKFEDARLIKENYDLPSTLITNKLDVRHIEYLVSIKKNISPRNKSKLLKSLNKLPDSIQVAKTITDLSVDVVIQSKNEVRLIEFHEKQHRNLTVGRATPIFIDDNYKIYVPRFAQRFLKDIWRFKYLNNFQVVWWDWFYSNSENAVSLFLNNPQKKEFFIDGKFSFTEFVQQ